MWAPGRLSFSISASRVRRADKDSGLLPCVWLVHLFSPDALDPREKFLNSAYPLRRSVIFSFAAGQAMLVLVAFVVAGSLRSTNLHVSSRRFYAVPY
jgi:hypothetical protein